MLNVTPSLLTSLSVVGAQSTQMGREIHRLAALSDRIYVCYGDYSVNTGPIHAFSIDPIARTITDEATFGAEETWVYREHNGIRYAAYMDPQAGEGNPEFGQWAYDSGSGWNVITNTTPYSVHVMDLLPTDDGVYLFGAANEPDPPNGGATVWFTPDLGATWELSLAPRPDPTNNARFYAAVQLDGVIYAVLDAGGGRTVYQKTSTAWEQVETRSDNISDLIPFSVNNVPFALIVPNGKQYGFSLSGPVSIFTAPERADARPTIQLSLPLTVKDAGVYNGYLYTLDSSNTLWRTDSLGARTAVFTSTVGASCFAIVGSTVFFGTTSSSIYTTELPGV